MRPRHHQAILTDHAWQRWQERSWKQVKRDKLQSLCTVRLNEAIGMGMIVDHTGAWFEVMPWLWAVAVLGTDGWVVKTFKVLEGKKKVG